MNDNNDKPQRLNAVNLKNALWETLHQVRTGKMEPHIADAVAVQSREIIRVTRSQLAVIRVAKEDISKELIEFAIPTTDLPEERGL